MKKTPSRPYVIVNVAMTADGKIDSAAHEGATISSDVDKERVDRLRAEVDAIVVGGKTLLQDDPRLTVRSDVLREQRRQVGMMENPMKVGVISVAALQPDSRFLTAGTARKLIFTTLRTPSEQIELLEKNGAEVYITGKRRVDLPAMLESLYILGCRKILVEGGGTLLSAFFRLKLVDELNIYLAPRIFGGAKAPTLADGKGFPAEHAPWLKLIEIEVLDEQGGILIRYHVKRDEE